MSRTKTDDEDWADCGDKWVDWLTNGNDIQPDFR